MENNILIAFGSPNDIPEHFNFDRLEDAEYFLSVASAHRTPKIVEIHAKSRKWDAVIAGAGMCNSLKDVYLKSCEPDTILVALPIRDSRTSGISSILSSSEMPRGYPVAMSRIGDLSAAVNFVNGALGKYDSVRIIDDKTPQSEKVREDAASLLSRFDIDFDCGYCFEAQAGRKLTILSYNIPNALNVEIEGPCICCYSTPFNFRDPKRSYPELMRFGSYFDCVERRPDRVHVGIADGSNLGLYAAKIVARSNPQVKERIAAYLEEDQHKSRLLEKL